MQSNKENLITLRPSGTLPYHASRRHSNSWSKTALKTIAALCALTFVVCYVIPLAMDRELYRMQKVCESNRANYNTNETCDYWEGERP